MVMVKAALANKELKTIPRNIARLLSKPVTLCLNEGKCMDQFPVDVFKVVRAHH